MTRFHHRVLGLAVAGALAIPSVSATAFADVPRPYKAKCASCHGEDGVGNTEAGKKAKVEDITKKKFDEAAFKKAILEGVKDKAGKQTMDPYKEKLKDPDVAKILDFLKTLAKG